MSYAIKAGVFAEWYFAVHGGRCQSYSYFTGPPCWISDLLRHARQRARGASFAPKDVNPLALIAPYRSVERYDKNG